MRAHPKINDGMKITSEYENKHKDYKLPGFNKLLP